MARESEEFNKLSFRTQLLQTQNSHAVAGFLISDPAFQSPIKLPPVEMQLN
jgi:hypothetical protein